jgi:hypothetical protein
MREIKVWSASHFLFLILDFVINITSTDDPLDNLNYMNFKMTHAANNKI